MKNNLYQTIKYLVDRKWELKKIGGYIKYDKSKRAEYELCAAEYNKIEKTLDFIKQNCFISSQKVAEILSKKHGTQYKLKIFRETGETAGETYYTRNFVICYLNNKNKYFNYDINGVTNVNWRGLPDAETLVNYSLSREQFKEMFMSLGETGAYVLTTYRELNFVLTLQPSAHLESVNFLNLFLYGSVDDFVSSDFQHLIKPAIKQYLEQIDADEFLGKMRTAEDEMTK